MAKQRKQNNAPVEQTLPEVTAEMQDRSTELTPQNDPTPSTDPVLDNSEIAAIEAATEGTETAEVQSEPAAATDPAPATAIAPDTRTINEAMDAVPNETVEELEKSIATAIDSRATYEAAKSPDNENIQRTLKKARNQMVSRRAARLLAACNVDPSFLNREIHAGARYNVYAIGKLADVVYGVTGGKVDNAINVAVMKSLFRFRAAGVPFTGEMAKAAASDKIRVDAAVKGHLVRHTVSAGTAPTQASSTMQALATLGVVKVGGTTRAPVYELLDTPLTRAIEAQLNPAPVPVAA